MNTVVSDVGDFITRCQENLSEEIFVQLLTSLQLVLERNDHLAAEVARIKVLLQGHKELFQQLFFVIPGPIRDAIITQELQLCQQKRVLDPQGNASDRVCAKNFLVTISKVNYSQYIDFLEMLIEYNTYTESSSFRFLVKQVEVIFADYPPVVLGLAKFFKGDEARQLEKLSAVLKEKKLNAKNRQARNLKRKADENKEEPAATRKPKLDKEKEKSEKEKAVTKTLDFSTDLDLASIPWETSERVGSYAVLAEAFQEKIVAKTPADCRDVLNTSLMLIPNSLRMNVPRAYSDQQNLFFSVEDDQHELDIQIEILRCTISRLEQLLDMVERLKPERAFNIDQLFPAIYRKCIENSFEGNIGKENFSGLYINPGSVIYEILSILSMKLQEYTRAKKDWSLTWRSKKFANKSTNLEHM